MITHRHRKNGGGLRGQCVELRRQLAEAVETIESIRTGGVDALVIEGPGGNQIYSLEGALQPYRLLIEEMQEGAVTISAAGRILYSNRRFAEFLGRPLDEIIGAEFETMIAPQDRAAFAHLMESASCRPWAREGHLQTVFAAEFPVRIAYNRIAGQSGPLLLAVVTDLREQRRRELELSAAATQLDERVREQIRLNHRLEEARVAAMNMMQDAVEARRALEQLNAELERRVVARTEELNRHVAELKRTEEALRASEERFRSIAASTPDHLLVQDCDLRYEMVVNPRLNLTVEQMVGHTDYDILAPEDAVELTRVKRQVLETDQPIHLEVPLIAKDGERHFFDGSYVPRHDANGRVDGLIGYFRDVTERKRSEEQIRTLNTQLQTRAVELEAANKELEAFSYSVSHDLRAPLRSIDGFSRILLRDCAAELDEQGRDHLDRIRRATQRMGQLIDDMLKLSRMARADLNLKPVDLSAFAQVALDELRRGEPSRQVTSTIQPALIAVADPVLIRSALDNLLQNAWKFTGRRSEARIEIGAADQGGERVFFVRDNGVGFDMTYARKLFGAFQRLHASEDFPGTGIGLATVQRIVHRHGGRIWAEAEPDAGATFFFTLGATAPHESASHPAR